MLPRICLTCGSRYRLAYLIKKSPVECLFGDVVEALAERLTMATYAFLDRSVRLGKIVRSWKVSKGEGWSNREAFSSANGVLGRTETRYARVLTSAVEILAVIISSFVVYASRRKFIVFGSFSSRLLPLLLNSFRMIKCGAMRLSNNLS